VNNLISRSIAVSSVFLLISLSACGGGSGSSNPMGEVVPLTNENDALEPDTENDTNTDTSQSNEPNNAAANDTVTDNEPDEQDQVDGSENSVITDLRSKDCGFNVGNPVISTSTDQDNPIVLTPGQFGEGRISNEPGEGLDLNHFWAFDASNGPYIFVVESQLTNNQSSNIGIIATPTQFLGTTDTPLYNSNEIRRRIRHAQFVEISGINTTENGLAGVRIQSRYGLQDYKVALFNVDEAVPTPFIDDCPSFRVTSPGTTESFQLDENNTTEWFIAELEAGIYDVILDTAVQGDRTNIQHTLSVTNIFNDIDSEIILAKTNEIDTNFRTVGAFEVFNATNVANLSVQLNSNLITSSYTLELTLVRR